MKRVFFLILFLFLFFVMLTPLHAKDEVQTENVSSFELFWPISAGKTLGDSKYFLKSLKESIRGMLIFGKPQKADYSVFLAVKRAVEAEKLIGLGENELAIKTLQKMSEQLTIAREAIASSEGMTQDMVNTINTRLDNLEIFLGWLITKSEPVKGTLESLLEQVKEVNSNI